MTVRLHNKCNATRKRTVLFYQRQRTTKKSNNTDPGQVTRVIYESSDYRTGSGEMSRPKRVSTGRRTLRGAGYVMPLKTNVFIISLLSIEHRYRRQGVPPYTF